MTSKAGLLFRLRQCLCPDCLCPQSYFAEHDRACVSCRLGMHTPTREYPASRSGAQGSQSRLAVGTPLAPSIRRPRTGELAAAAISESEAELREAWGK